MKDKSENKYIAHVKRDDKEKWTTPHLLSSHLEGGLRMRPRLLHQNSIAAKRTVPAV